MALSAPETLLALLGFSFLLTLLLLAFLAFFTFLLF